jgi:endogenous inhibitor of DNA gyrase (YacG/DUF329 family)
MSERPLCAYCRQQPIEHRFRPFCSERCKQADLGRWLQGDYRIAGPEPDESLEGRPSQPDDDIE